MIGALKNLNSNVMAMMQKSSVTAISPVRQSNPSALSEQFAEKPFVALPEEEVESGLFGATRLGGLLSSQSLSSLLVASDLNASAPAVTSSEALSQPIQPVSSGNGIVQQEIESVSFSEQVSEVDDSLKPHFQYETVSEKREANEIATPRFEWILPKLNSEEFAQVYQMPTYAVPTQQQQPLPTSSATRAYQVASELKEI